MKAHQMERSISCLSCEELGHLNVLHEHGFQYQLYELHQLERTKQHKKKSGKDTRTALCRPLGEGMDC